MVLDIHKGYDSINVLLKRNYTYNKVLGSLFTRFIQPWWLLLVCLDLIPTQIPLIFQKATNLNPHSKTSVWKPILVIGQCIRDRGELGVAAEEASGSATARIGLCGH